MPLSFSLQFFNAFGVFFLQMRSAGVFDTAQSALRQAANRKQSVGESRLGFMSEVKKELEVSAAAACWEKVPPSRGR